MSAPLCAHCTSHDRRACEGVRQFATITASCSCGCHFVPQAGGAVVLVSANALAAAEADCDAQRTRAKASEAEVARLRAAAPRTVPPTEAEAAARAVDEALSVIAGYAIALDMVVRGPEDRSLRKSGDSYAVLGPWLVTADEVADPQNLDLWLDLNGQRMQTGNTRTMIFSVAELISYVSRFMTLEPGDIVTTGTPPGVGMGRKTADGRPAPQFLQPGDVLQLGGTGLGSQRQRVRAFSA